MRFNISTADSSESDFENFHLLKGKKGNSIINSINMDYYLVPCHTRGHLLYHF